MRPDVGLIQALRAPFALNLKALRALLAQNQLRLGRHGRHGGTPRRGIGRSLARWRGRGPERHGRCSPGLVAAGGLAAAALLGSGAGELARPRPAGAAGGGRRVSRLRSAVRLPARERAGGRGGAGQDRRRRARHRARDRRPAGHGALPQSGLAAPDRPARRPACHARGAVRRRAGFGAGLLPPQPRSRARRGARGGVLRPLAPGRRTRRAAGCALPCAPFWRPSAMRPSGA